MDQVHVIRHKVLVEGHSVRWVARRLGVSRNTVKKYLSQAAPARVETAPRPRPVFERVRARLAAILAESPRWTGGKQRLTATRLHRMLVEEGFSVGVTLVKDTMAEWKRRRREVSVPLVYPPGDLAEVDFFEVLVDVVGTRRKAFMFVMRLMHSGRDFAWLYDRQDQVCFLDGHVRAFAHFGVVPQRIAYDNLRAAVRKILVGSERLLSARFEALVSHYLFEACFCRPRTGSDKGGVESRGKSIRWQHLVPIPKGDQLVEMSAALLSRLDASADAARFAVERAAMLPLAARPFDPAATHFLPVSKRSLVALEGAVYSVHCEWAWLDVTVRVGADRVEIVGPGKVVVTHPRKRFGGRSIDYRHYVRELARKPQAVRQVAAELVRDLGDPFPSVWRSLVDAHGPRDAARIFAKLLGHVERRGLVEVARELTRALELGQPLLLALAPAPALTSASCVEVPASLRAIEVACAKASDFDALLCGGAS
jgi:transposase